MRTSSVTRGRARVGGFHHPSGPEPPKIMHAAMLWQGLSDSAPFARSATIGSFVHHGWHRPVSAATESLVRRVSPRPPPRPRHMAGRPARRGSGHAGLSTALPGRTVLYEVGPPEAGRAKAGRGGGKAGRRDARRPAPGACSGRCSKRRGTFPRAFPPPVEQRHGSGGALRHRAGVGLHRIGAHGRWPRRSFAGACLSRSVRPGPR